MGPKARDMIKCDVCPRCKDSYPDKVDSDGYHFCICGMTGNKVYTEPRMIKRHAGSGYIHFSTSSCGLYETVEDVLSHMTETEIRRWEENK